MFFVYECETGLIDGFYKHEGDAMEAASFWKEERGKENFVSQVAKKPKAATIPDNMRLPFVYRKSMRGDL
jgi:hypothetical protein